MNELNGYHTTTVEEVEQLEEERSIYPVKRLADLLTQQPQNWMLRRFLRASASGYMYGQSGTAKTGAAVDIAMRRRYGMDWHGVPLALGPTVYVTGEGDDDISALVRAFESEHAVEIAQATEVHDFLVIAQSVPLDQPDALTKLARTIRREMPDEHADLVIFDTLATCLDGAKEESNSDMTRVNRNLRTFIRVMKCSTLVIHHSGKSEAAGLRGASAIKNDADSVILMEALGEEKFRMTVQKIKGRKIPEPWFFQQKVIDFDVKNNLDEVEQGYVLEMIGVVPSAKTIERRTKEQIMLDALQDKELQNEFGEVKTGDWEKAVAEHVTSHEFYKFKEMWELSGRIWMRKGNPAKGEHNRAQFYKYVDVEAELLDDDMSQGAFEEINSAVNNQ